MLDLISRSDSISYLVGLKWAYSWKANGHQAIAYWCIRNIINGWSTHTGQANSSKDTGQSVQEHMDMLNME